MCVDRKRYERAESEYVAAKLDLHRKTEVKEQLTEHLYAIIQQNELRKAEKLQELMLQLHTAEGARGTDAPTEAPEPRTPPAACRGEGPARAESGEGGGAGVPEEAPRETQEKCVVRETPPDAAPDCCPRVAAEAPDQH